MCPLKPLASRSCGHILTLFTSLFMMAFLMGSRALGQITGVAAEGASTIGKSRFMISGYYSTAILPEKSWRDNIIHQPGLKLGLGVSEVVDIKLYFSRWAVIGSDYRRNVFQLITKVTGVNQMVALYLPLGLIYDRYKMDYEGSDIGKLWMATPRIIGTLVRKDHFDLCIIPYAEVLKEKSQKLLVTGGVNLGVGFFPHPGRLSLRFEGGINICTMAAGYSCGTLGIGINYILGRRK